MAYFIEHAGLGERELTLQQAFPQGADDAHVGAVEPADGGNAVGEKRSTNWPSVTASPPLISAANWTRSGLSEPHPAALRARRLARHQQQTQLRLLVRFPHQEHGADIHAVMLEPAARGLGIGRRLVAECIGFAGASGYRRVTLWTNESLGGRPGDLSAGRLSPGGERAASRLWPPDGRRGLGTGLALSLASSTPVFRRPAPASQDRSEPCRRAAPKTGRLVQQLGYERLPRSVSAGAVTVRFRSDRPRASKLSNRP